VLREKLFAETPVAEGFGTAGAQSRERAGDVARGGAEGGRISLEISREKTRVEAVACTDGVHRCYLHGRDLRSDAALEEESAARAAFDDDQRNESTDGGESFVERGGIGDAEELVLIREQDVYQRKDAIEDASPTVVGIVVGVEGYRKSTRLELPQEIWQAGMEAGLEEEGREVEVAAGGEVINVEDGAGEFGHGARIGEDAACGAVRKQDSDPGCGAGLGGNDAGEVDAAFGKTVEGDGAERIAAEAGDEADRRPEDGKIVREDGGGAAEGELEIAGEQFALNRQFGG